MNYQELEIKILNIDKEQIKKKLIKIGAEFKKSRIQKIYTYDCYSPILMYYFLYQANIYSRRKNIF